MPSVIDLIEFVQCDAVHSDTDHAIHNFGGSIFGVDGDGGTEVSGQMEAGSSRDMGDGSEVDKRTGRVLPEDMLDICDDTTMTPLQADVDSTGHEQHEDIGQEGIRHEGIGQEDIGSIACIFDNTGDDGFFAP